MRRVVRFLFTWKMAGRLLFVAACLVTLLVLLLVEENWRGKRDWQAFVREHEAGGDRLDMAPLIPPPVPDEQNFAMTPLFKPLFAEGPENYRDELAGKFAIPTVEGKTPPSMGDHSRGRHIKLEEWQACLGGDVAGWLQKVDPELAEISEAARRPYARFPIAYEKGIGMSLPHVSILMKIGKLYALRAEVELQAGRADAALADVQTIFRLGESMQSDPVLISQLVWISEWQMGLQVAWEGMEEHRWTDAQLQVLQGELGRADFLKGLSLALHGERAVFNEALQSAALKPDVLASMMTMTGDESDRNAWRFATSGLIYRNLLAINRFHEKYDFPAVDAKARRVYPGIVEEGEHVLMREKAASFFGLPAPNPYKILEFILMPAYTGITSKVAFAQVSTDEALIACALERYRLAKGGFPDALEKLVPDYIKAVPLDVVNGEAPHYRLNADGTYLLYSGGWDGKDDGGKLVLKPDKSGVDIMKSDWVWSAKPD